MQTGGQPYASWEVPPRVSEEKHGPHNHMLPQRGMPGPRPHRSGHYGYPGMEGEALPLHAVSQDVQRHHRHGLLAAAHHSRDGRPLRWTPPKHHGRPLGARQRLVRAAARDHGSGRSYRGVQARR
jgi:hypothetical protein